MNLALPGLLIILGLVPGIVFWNGYFSGKFPRHFGGVSPILELAQYIIFAIPINVLGLWLYVTYVGSVDLELVHDALLGSATSESIADGLGDKLARTAGWYVLLIIAAAFLGIALRHIVWGLRLDLRFPALRVRSNWYYSLQGRSRSLPRWHVMPYADVICEHPDGSRIYQGMVVGFEPTSDGQIRSLLLEDAHRGKGRGDEFQWAKIPGDQLIIMGENIHSINMRYIQAEEIVLTRWEKLSLLTRSLLLEEP